MFERIIFKNAPGGGPLIDVGYLAEALIFYGHANVICNSATLEYLASNIPPRVLLDLMKSQRATFHYLNEQVAVVTAGDASGRPVHGLAQIAASDPSPTEKATKAVLKSTTDKRVVREIVSNLKVLSHAGFETDQTLATLVDSEVTERAALTGLRAVVPGVTLPDKPRFSLQREASGGFFIDTNIDFDIAVAAHRAAFPGSDTKITPAYLVALVQGTYEDLHFAGQMNSEIAVGLVGRAMHTEILGAIVGKTLRSQEQLHAFTDLTLDSAHAIRDAVNRGQVPFADIVRLLDRADKFRDWLQKQPPDSDLVKAYYKAVVADTWVEKLPGKSSRWGVFTAAGLAIDACGAGGLGTLAGVALSALDAFVLDKVIGGWKPHHFVERDLMRTIQLDRD